LAPHRVNEPDECLRSICDLRIVLDEHPADMLRDGAAGSPRLNALSRKPLAAS
jgi:hypothetical protein